jgi:hypothetical protein
MRPDGDLMERLAAADPRPEAEQLSPAEQSEADALLARLLASPAESGAGQRRSARRPRRLAVAAIGVLCSAAAAFAAVNLIDSDGSGPGVVERAVAAVTRGDAVYHVLERSHMSAPGVKPRTFYFEFWHTSGGRYHGKTYAARGGRRGKLLQDMAGRRLPGRRGGPALVWNSGSNIIVAMGFAQRDPAQGAPGIDRFADPGGRLRALEEQGRLRMAGTTRVGNRRAYRLVSGVVPSPPVGDEESVEFLVDAETYLPLAEHRSIRLKSGAKLEFRNRYLVYERLPLNARTRVQLDLDPHPGAMCPHYTRDLKGDRAPGFPNPCAGR